MQDEDLGLDRLMEEADPTQNPRPACVGTFQQDGARPLLHTVAKLGTGSPLPYGAQPLLRTVAKLGTIIHRPCHKTRYS